MKVTKDHSKTIPGKVNLSPEDGFQRDDPISLCENNPTITIQSLVKIHFDDTNHGQVSATVIRMTPATTVGEMVSASCLKANIPLSEMNEFVLMAVYPKYPHDPQSRQTARTLKKEENLMATTLDLMKMDANDNNAREAFNFDRFKFYLKDTRSVPLFLEKPTATLKPEKLVADIRKIPEDLRENEELEETTPDTANDHPYSGLCGIAHFGSLERHSDHDRQSNGLVIRRETEAPSLYRGYLRKQSQKDEHVWKRRFVTLEKDRLVYSKSPESDVRRYVVLLSKCTVSRLNVHEFILFVDVSPHENVQEYHFRSENIQHIEHWLELLQVYIPLTKENEFLFQAEFSLRMAHQDPESDEVESFVTAIFSQPQDKKFEKFLQNHQDLPYFQIFSECIQFQLCCLGNCHQPQPGKEAATECSASDQWQFARKIIDDFLSISSNVALEQIRKQIQSQLLNQRLHLAQSNSLEHDISPPSVHLLDSLQYECIHVLHQHAYRQYLANQQESDYVQLLRSIMGH